MTPREFITKWQNSQLKERAAAQSHFLDLCRLLDEPEPAAADPTGKDYGFEVGASKTTGGQGFADVFKRGHFGWEYKGTKANLDAAFAQLQRYAIALDNPPLLIVSDIGTTIRIHTNWTNSVSKTYEIAIADLEDPEKRGWLKAALSDPETLRPTKTRQELTEEVAGDFARLARSLRERGHVPEEVAHFINRLVFCMFAEDVGLLPNKMFARMIAAARPKPETFQTHAATLFAASHPLSFRQASHAVMQVRRQIGAEAHDIHGLRHAAAGCSDELIMAVTGHESRASVVRYAAAARQKPRAKEAQGRRT